MNNNKEVRANAVKMLPIQNNLVYPGLGHVYTPEMWAHTLDWFESRLK